MSEFVLMSIAPRWVREIVAGRKRFEYRKRAPSKSPPFRVVVYCTAPRKEVVGEFQVVDSACDSIEALIDHTVAGAAREPADIRRYFGDSDTGHALEIGAVVEYDRPVGLAELRDEHGLEPPQNFRYLSSEEYSAIRG
jgi:predicted transcriptional regulator